MHPMGQESGSWARDPHKWGYRDPHAGRNSAAKANTKVSGHTSQSRQQG